LRKFSQTRRRQTDPNQAEDFSPQGSSPLPDPQSELRLSGEKKGRTMNPLIQLKKAIPVFLVALACFGLSPMA
jgi:hypothetical protein